MHELRCTKIRTLDLGRGAALDDKADPGHYTAFAPEMRAVEMDFLRGCSGAFHAFSHASGSRKLKTLSDFAAGGY